MLTTFANKSYLFCSDNAEKEADKQPKQDQSEVAFFSWFYILFYRNIFFRNLVKPKDTFCTLQNNSCPSCTSPYSGIKFSSYFSEIPEQIWDFKEKKIRVL
jgi:hypothetical protein